MNRQVNAISGRLSLRPPQRESLEILDRVVEMTELLEARNRVFDKNSVSKNSVSKDILDIISAEYPNVSDFERAFPSLCFALATGVGKTRLMGAFISYLYLAHGLRNYFVLAPNLTIYDKLIGDFQSSSPKYVFKGIAEFAVAPPLIVTGEDYESGKGVRDEGRLQPYLSSDPAYSGDVHINIFNISKINSEVRGGKSPRMKRLSEYIGDSYFNYLAQLPDLVLLMDESHRYRASSGVRAINELKPILGLELTATPFVEKGKGAIPFKNVIYDYSLAHALQDGFVKEPAVVTQKNFRPQDYSREELERIKLEDGIRLHESVKVELETYARQNETKRVKPFMLIIARDTTHASELLEVIQSDSFFEGRYREKVIQVDSSTKGKKEDEMVQRLLAVESPDEPTEIVIHVNMLKEGWDVTNLYTIVPLRAANARVLIEQSIGRGLRLPYGRRTGVAAVDRLNIVAHDKFQEIIDEANRPDSMIKLTQVILEPTEAETKIETVAIAPKILDNLRGEKPPQTASLMPMAEENGVSSTTQVEDEPTPLFQTEADQQVAELTYHTIQRYESLPSSAELSQPEVKEQILNEVKAQYLAPTQNSATQPELPGMEVVPEPDFNIVVDQTIEMYQQQTIDIPRVVVVPKGEVITGFDSFELDTSNINYQPVDRDLLIQSLQTNQQTAIHMATRVASEKRLEDYLMRHLVDFPDISYDEQADLLYDLASQIIHHLESYLDEEDVSNVLRVYEKPLAEQIHAQMQAHRWEKAVGYDVQITRGFTKLKEGAASNREPERNFRQPLEAGERIRQLIFVGFKRCLYPKQKFDTSQERILAIILDRDAQKWFRPQLGQFQIYYKDGVIQREYQPDFVAETADCIYMLEPKARNAMQNVDVLAKRDAAIEWCDYASQHALDHNGKPWRYILIPHDAIAENITLEFLVSQFG